MVTNSKGTASTQSFVTVTVHLLPPIKNTVHSIFDIIRKIMKNPSGLNSNTITSLRDASQSLTNYNLPNSPAYLPCSVAQLSLDNLYRSVPGSNNGQLLSNEQLNAIHNALGCR